MANIGHRVGKRFSELARQIRADVTAYNQKNQPLGKPMRGAWHKATDRRNKHKKR